MSIHDERRTEERLPHVFSVYIRGAWGSSLGIARNISEGGMFLEIEDPYPLGSRLEITFAFPGSEAEMTAMAEVVHLCFLTQTPAGGPRSVSVGLGIRFLSFLSEAQPVEAPVAAEWLQ